MIEDQFSHRWGIPWLDAGFQQVPNFFFDHYCELGISPIEFLFILHLSRYKYESSSGYCCPSLGTIAVQMGMSRQGVGKLRVSLETSGWLTIRRRIGETSLYDFQAFSLAMMRMAEIAARPRLPGPGVGGGHPRPGGYTTPVVGGYTTPVVGGIQPQLQGGTTPVVPKNKQETEEKQQQDPGGGVFSPSAEEGERGDQESYGRKDPSASVPVWELNGDLQDVGIGQERGADLLRKYGAERIAEVLAAVRARKDEIRDLPAWIVTALRKGYAFSPPAAVAAQVEVNRKKQLNCAGMQNPGLGECPSFNAGALLFLWCSDCEKVSKC